MVVNMPGLITANSAVIAARSAAAFALRWLGAHSADGSAPRSPALQPSIVLAAIDRIELHRVARFHQKRIVPKRVERLHPCPADQLPASWRLSRVHARLTAGNGHRAGGYAYARRRAPG